jgi:nuclear pore complex protein Nup188
VQDDLSIQALVLPMQAISSIISVAMIDLADCLALLSNPRLEEQVSSNIPVDRPFLLNSQTILEINTIILGAADQGLTTAGPAIFVWSVILQTMSERVGESQESSHYERQSSNDTELTLAPDVYSNVMEHIMDSIGGDDNIIDILARTAVNHCNLFETISALSLRLGSTSDAFFSNSMGAQMRMTLLDIIKSSTRIGYIPEIVEATLSTLNAGQTYWDILDSKHPVKIDDPVVAFLDDEILLQHILANAKSRYPYEPLPFLKIIHSLAAKLCFSDDADALSALKILEDLSVFTYVLPPDFSDYETTQEEDNNNNIRLTKDIQLFESRSRAARYQPSLSSSLALTTVDADFCIRAGTLGRIISDTGPRVAFWFHSFSGLKYIGKLLETFLTASDQVDSTTGMPTDRDSVSEIIGILATLLLSITRSSEHGPSSREDAERVLNEASSGLSRNRDITTVIFDIFEEELQKKSSFSGSDVSLEVLVSCLHFIHAMVPIFPGRVWPLMSRTSLLGAGGGRLASIVESVELLSGKYDFLISCCRLYEALVDDFSANAIHRRQSNKSAARYHQHRDNIGIGIPNQVLSKILLSFTRYFLDVLESSRDWKYASHDDRRRLSWTVGKTFDKLLQYSYGVDSPLEPTTVDDQVSESPSILYPPPKKDKDKVTKIMEPLVLSASHIVDSFLTSSAGQSRFQPLLRAYFDGLETPETTTCTPRLSLWTDQVNSILLLSKTLLQVSTLIGRPTSNFEDQIFKSSSLIARLYATNDIYRNSVISIFESLLISTSNHTAEPPSLLGHLGPQTARNFLHLLSDLDKPLLRDESISRIWHFMSIVVSSRQQWFANYLLTGKTPRDALKTKTVGKELVTLDRTLLTAALSKLSDISKLSSLEALAMLEFVALSQNFWPWTVGESTKYPDFIKAISEYVGNLKPLQQANSIDDSINACHQTRIAAYIAEIFAMHVFHSRQTGANSHVKDIISNLDYFERFAVAPPKNRGYNTSLHSLLKSNFEARYPGSTLRDLKRTTLDHRNLGKDYFYNLSLAEKMLGREEAWSGRKNDGIKAELENANVNLSLVDAQIVSDIVLSYY